MNTTQSHAPQCDWRRAKARPTEATRRRRFELPHFPQAPVEKAALALVGGQLQRPAIAFRGLHRTPQTPQQIGARGVQQMIAVQLAAGASASSMA